MTAHLCMSLGAWHSWIVNTLIVLKLWMALLIQTSVSCGSHNLLQCSLLAFPWPKLFKNSHLWGSFSTCCEDGPAAAALFEGFKEESVGASELLLFYSWVCWHLPLLCCMPAVQWLKRKDCRGWWGQLVSGWDYKPSMRLQAQYCKCWDGPNTYNTEYNYLPFWKVTPTLRVSQIKPCWSPVLCVC